MIRKVIAIILMFLLSLGIIGCDRSEFQSTTTTTAPVVTSLETETSRKETTATTTRRKTEATSERITETVSETTETVSETTRPTVKETTVATTKSTTKATTAKPTTTAAPTTKATTTAKPTTKATTAKPTTTAPTPTPVPTPVPTSASEQEILMHLTEQQYKDQVFNEINNLRARNGKPTLAKATGEYAILQQMADIRAKELAQSFGHSRPDGRDYVTIASDMGYDYYEVGALTNGDIIARLPYYEMQHVINASPQHVVNNGWHESYSHRMIMLQDGTEEYTRPNTHMAVGYYNGRATNTGTRCQYVIVIFGKERLN